MCVDVRRIVCIIKDVEGDELRKLVVEAKMFGGMSKEDRWWRLRRSVVGFKKIGCEG